MKIDVNNASSFLSHHFLTQESSGQGAATEEKVHKCQVQRIRTIILSCSDLLLSPTHTRSSIPNWHQIRIKGIKDVGLGPFLAT